MRVIVVTTEAQVVWASSRATGTPGCANAGKRVLILMADLEVRVIDVEGELLRHFELDPSVDYQRRNRDRA